MRELCHRVLAVNCYDDFFAMIGQPKPTKERLHEILRARVANSLRRGYHERQVGLALPAGYVAPVRLLTYIATSCCSNVHAKGHREAFFT